MLFPTHLLAAALLGRVSRLSPLWLVVGTAFPDVVDKPLASVGVTPLYHSIGHSALLVVVALPLALSGRTGLSAAAGWALHLLLDTVHVVLNGRPGDAVFLLWPVLTPMDPLALPPGSFFVYYLWSPSFFLEVALWLTTAGLLARHATREGRAGSRDRVD
ncbi:metal-dependent hydrolase [Haloarcula rubripromontorii]|uniref:Metal-dependent hydrolase n=1 Tax=Haloarcula rubripromontorii TaxID=1705562 RepID=A0A847U0Y0_9EURY|nr:metal-dependent hydrolase [Haloarcula rubripromontorii]NLV04534.1 metal-dependent hydrolase [Haloarcula rubripromontorii]